MLTKVMAAFARPTRLVKSQKMDPSTEIDDKLFEVEEERQLQAVFRQVASKVMQLQRHAGPSLHPKVQPTYGLDTTTFALQSKKLTTCCCMTAFPLSSGVAC